MNIFPLASSQSLSFSSVLMGFCWGDLKERDHWEELGIDGSIILKCIFRIEMGRFRLN
jgi:hypothetical protein